MAQINTTVGDFDGNTKKILKYIAEARSQGVDLLSFPELAICSYPPEDLLFKPHFIDENLRALEKVIEGSSGITIAVGFVAIDDIKGIYNAAAVIHDGKLAGVYYKICLPNYGVFDEQRYFLSGRDCSVYVLNDVSVGINICEDVWHDAAPLALQAHSGAEIIVNLSASPYHFGKGNFREKMLKAHASENLVIIAHNNLVGGQDELVFDGNSLILDEKGQLIARGKQFEEDLIVADLDADAVSNTRLHDSRLRKKAMPANKDWCTTTIVLSQATSMIAKPPLMPRQITIKEPEAEVYSALVLGTRDYIHKNRIEKVVIGLSGGVDSSLVAAIAVDALESSNVIGVAMPSRYSSPGSVSDAEALARNLGIRILNIPIEKVFKSYLEILTPSFEGTAPNVAEENLQARIRGNLLMALSNKFGWLVLTTGNKSETATGYATLYGDMAGGFAVIKDVTKTLVYKLARYRNSLAGYDFIPSSVIDKVPSAELRPGQKDTDSLPPYDMLDPVLTAYVEDDKSVGQIIEMGIDDEIVKKVARLVDISEYKRRQAPPGVKITPRAFGRDRRLPITNRFKGTQ